MTTLARYLNQLDHEALGEALHQCCAARLWIDRMRSLVPFQSDAEIESTATQVWQDLHRDTWLEAFEAHPRIGDVATLRAKFANTRQWAGSEQAGVEGADEQTIRRLAELNGQYFEKFGFIFIICATGKTAQQMLAALESRLPNDLETELQIAAAEQLKITLLRLRKLVT